MILVMLVCLALIAITTAIHYEALGFLSDRLVTSRIPSRAKLLVVVFVLFFAHLVEIGLYGAAMYALVQHAEVGGFAGSVPMTLENCLYLSAETYTSLGFGDVTPSGKLRMIAGVETLNGLLLIGWSASYLYISMERFWRPTRHTR